MEIVNDIGVEKGKYFWVFTCLAFGCELVKTLQVELFFNFVCVLIVDFVHSFPSQGYQKLSNSQLACWKPLLSSSQSCSKILRACVLHISVCIHLHFVISSFPQAFKLVKIKFKCFVCYVALLFCLSVLCMLCNLGLVFFVSFWGFQFWASGYFLSFLCHVFCFCPSSISNSIQFFALGFKLLYIVFMPLIHGILVFKVASLFICV
jgi:hypothetical protein